MSTRPHILMCPPDYYGIEYEINPWMSRTRQADQKLAMEQWNGLVAVLTRLGVEISQLTPAAGLPLVSKAHVKPEQANVPDVSADTDHDRCGPLPRTPKSRREK